MTNHVWVDGPDGIKYHCAICGVSKVENVFSTCEFQMEEYVTNRYKHLDWKEEEWRKYLLNPNERKPRTPWNVHGRKMLSEIWFQFKKRLSKRND